MSIDLNINELNTLNIPVKPVLDKQNTEENLKFP